MPVTRTITTLETRRVGKKRPRTSAVRPMFEHSVSWPGFLVEEINRAEKEKGVWKHEDPIAVGSSAPVPVPRDDGDDLESGLKEAVKAKDLDKSVSLFSGLAEKDGLGRVGRRELTSFIQLLASERRTWDNKSRGSKLAVLAFRELLESRDQRPLHPHVLQSGMRIFAGSSVERTLVLLGLHKARGEPMTPFLASLVAIAYLAPPNPDTAAASQVLKSLLDDLGTEPNRLIHGEAFARMIAASTVKEAKAWHGAVVKYYGYEPMSPGKPIVAADEFRVWFDGSLGLALGRGGLVEDCLRLLENYIDKEISNDALRTFRQAVVTAYLWSGGWEKANELYLEWTSDGKGTNAETCAAVMEALKDRGQYDEAMDLFSARVGEADGKRTRGLTRDMEIVFDSAIRISAPNLEIVKRLVEAKRRQRLHVTMENKAVLAGCFLEREQSIREQVKEFSASFDWRDGVDAAGVYYLFYGLHERMEWLPRVWREVVEPVLRSGGSPSELRDLWYVSQRITKPKRRHDLLAELRGDWASTELADGKTGVDWADKVERVMRAVARQERPGGDRPMRK